jgi:hypothetical protein
VGPVQLVLIWCGDIRLAVVNDDQSPQASDHDRATASPAFESLQSELRRLHRRIDHLLESLDRGQRVAVDRVARSTRPALQHLTSGKPWWPVSIAILAMLILQALIPGELTFSGHWVLPAIELILLCVLVAANPRRITRRSPVLRALGLSLIGIACLVGSASESWSPSGHLWRPTRPTTSYWREHLTHEYDHLRTVVLGTGPRRSSCTQHRNRSST